MVSQGQPFVRVRERSIGPSTASQTMFENGAPCRTRTRSDPAGVASESRRFNAKLSPLTWSFDLMCQRLEPQLQRHRIIRG
jgi:hypothetical protein